MSSSSSFFDNFADTFDTFYDGKRNSLMQRIDKRFRSDMFIRYAMTFELLGDLSGKHILDIGCGSGPYIIESLKRGAAHVTGIDPAPRMLELASQRVAQKNMSEKVTLVRGHFPQTRPQIPFDYAIVMGVMDYIEDAAGFLRGILQVVSNGAVLSFPGTHWFRTPFRKMRYRLRNCPVYFYNNTKIAALLHKAGITQYKLKKISGAGMDYVVWIEP